MSDIHYEKDFHHRVWEGDALKWMLAMVERHNPEDLVILGDTGEQGWDEEEWETLIEKVRLHIIYGNHDNVEMLKNLRNVDRSRVWAKDGEVREIQGLRFGFINGIIFYNKKRKPLVPRKLPEEYLDYARILAAKQVDVLCTHASLPMPSEFSKFAPTEEFATIGETIALVKPRIALSGHLSGPYMIGQIGGTGDAGLFETRFVRIDSSPQEKHYLLLKGDGSDKILIYHDGKQVKEIKY